MKTFQNDGQTDILNARKELAMAILYRGAYCASSGDMRGFLHALAELKTMPRLSA